MSWLSMLRSRSVLRRALRDVGPADTCLDFGANVGEFTVMMATTGARVVAFEPDPVAYAELHRRTVRLPNVTAINKAVAATDGTAELWFHADRASDPVRKSKSSTLLSGKGGIGGEHVTVATVGVVGLVQGLGSDIAVLKMDVEGAEVEILTALLDAGLVSRVRRAFVELHDDKIPALAAPTAALRARLAAAGATRFDLDWN